MEAVLEFAEHEFNLNVRQKDGASLREHLEVVHMQIGKMPEQLKPVDIPDFVNYLWQWFLELSRGRGYAEYGPMPLSYSEIKAWAQLTKTELQSWELNVIKKIDLIYLAKEIKK
ncbi:MAG: hypothetical protein QMD11_07970 [Smithella sp.]|nr:hypothetical protein [Smithella sp.]